MLVSEGVDIPLWGNNSATSFPAVSPSERGPVSENNPERSENDKYTLFVMHEHRMDRRWKREYHIIPLRCLPCCYYYHCFNFKPFPLGMDVDEKLKNFNYLTY